MSTPDDNTRINANDDTVIGVDASDDTIIKVPIDETVVGSVEIIDDSTVIGDVVPSEETVITSDDTVIPETTEDYHTLIGSMMDTSLGLRGLIDTPEEISGDESDTAPQQDLRSRFQLRHINGTKHSLSKPLIMGRLPAAPLRGGQSVNLVMIASPDGLVSSTHARFEVVGDVVVVTDLRSTNGTRVIIPGQPTTLLAPGDSMALGVGAIIDLGDGNRLEVLG
ncbi:FHA domain-containing protein [uncultured Aurantimicrobium sp.]|uniref:FHA domain-containing protein n=1 Tax=uncultured Aurantimicrobium sp. TaxID=1705357 RepID=UPI002606776E|nr:FHA domain-containing protein [uncultured Aurantimicrobium sp.]